MQQTDSAGGSRSTRRVQWPADLGEGRSNVEHVSIPVVQGAALDRTRSLTSPGAQDELRRALEAHNRSTLTDEETDDEDFASRGGYHSEAVSRATSSDGDPGERLEQLKDKMDVFVDPGETDGLPDTRKRNPEERSAKAAWNLVRGMTNRGPTGGGMRRRKTGAGAGGQAGFKSGTGANAEKEEEHDEKEGQSRASAFMDRMRDDGVADVPQDQQFGATAGVGGGGILSALIALQRQQNEPASAGTSGINTPASGVSTRANSINGDLSDEEEEEAERLKFISKLHEKRANKNRLHQLSGQIGNGATGVVVGAGRGAGAMLGGAGNVGGAMLKGAGKAGGAMMGGAGRAVGQVTGGLQPKGQSRNPSAAPSANPSPNHSPENSISTTPAQIVPVANTPERKDVDAVKAKREKEKDNKGLFNRVRDVVEREKRPDAAKSSAGVIGGLMLGAVRYSSSSCSVECVLILILINRTLSLVSPHLLQTTSLPRLIDPVIMSRATLHLNYRELDLDPVSVETRPKPIVPLTLVRITQNRRPLPENDPNLITSRVIRMSSRSVLVTSRIS